LLYLTCVCSGLETQITPSKKSYRLPLTFIEEEEEEEEEEKEEEEILRISLLRSSIQLPFAQSPLRPKILFSHIFAKMLNLSSLCLSTSTF
jgi:hypothetical protein